MNKRTPETISTLVDGELNDWEWKGAIQTLEQDRELQSCWRNYHLIGDAMRGGLPKYVGMELAGRVSRALEHEPFHFKPQNPSLPSSQQLSRTKTAIGFALAASLSAVAVFGVMGVEQRQKLQGAEQVASTSDRAVVPSVSGPGATAAAPGGVLTVADDAAASERKQPPKFLGTLMPVKPMLVAEKKDVAPAQARRAQNVLVARALPTEGDLYDYLLNYHQYSAQNDNEALSYLRDVRVVSYAASQ
jgi:sigma-E factor negative regulatory protein RseA